MKFYHSLLMGLSLHVTAFTEEPATKPTSGVEEVLPSEDLMREHGALDRIMLIYQNIIQRIDNFQTFPIDSLKKSAELVRSFIEDYHEKLEEDYLFTRMEKANVQVDLIKTLKEQHQKGRILTDYILAHANENDLKSPPELKMMKDTLQEFLVMYRPHAAREDTVLFPEFKKLISQQEYDSLGAIFEEKEHQLFGENGFDQIVNEIASIEKKLGIYTLSQFSPKK